MGNISVDRERESRSIANYAGRVSERRPEKKKKTKPVGEKTPQEIWVGSMAHALKSLSYEGLKALRLEGLCPHLLSMYSNKAR